MNKQVRGSRLVMLLAMIGLVLGSLVAVAAPAQATDSVLCTGFSACAAAGYTTHGYDGHYNDAPYGSGIGYWRASPGHNCTQYVGYMLGVNGNSRHDTLMGLGSQWDDNAAALGYTVDGVPAVGAIAQWESNASPATSSGHVAYVEQVTQNSSGVVTSIETSEDNFGGDFKWRNIEASGGWWPSHFLHIADVGGGSGSSSYSNGTYLAASGVAYVVAGGAPLPIGSWSDVGGVQPYTNVSQSVIDGMRAFPSDGTFVHAQPSGRNFVFAGGAPFYVSDWSHVGGAQSTTTISDYAIDHFNHVRPYPVDGTFVHAQPSGRNFVFAGGGPLYVANWSDVGGSHSTITVDDWPIDNHYIIPAYPVNNTAVRAMPSGRNFIFAGGGPLYVSDWSHVGGTYSTVTVSDWTIDNHYFVQPYPVDGTIVNAMPRGSVYIYAGGAPVAVNDWSNIGGVQPYTTVDQWPLDNHYFSLAYPKNGTYLKGYTSGSYYLSNGSSISSTSSNSAAVVVDDWAITHQL